MNQSKNRFTPNEIETKIYNFWLEKNIFNPKKMDNPFSIVLPPPNVTGKLHLGHAWDVSLQDAIIRYKKLNGYDVLWVPGTDHAGIATQTKFEKQLFDVQKETRYSLGRELFLEKLMVWKNDQANFIRKQWKKMGLALSNNYEKFTMDPDINFAVNKVFVDLYKNGLIYRANKLVNWDPVLKTAISNIEVIHKETESKMYYFKYYDETKTEYLIVATTRPETMFGDVCLVMNPNDPRCSFVKDKKFINPANNELLPVIFDDYVDISFGTGVMKCTPAHDFNDNELGKRHNLLSINIMNIDGTMNEKCGKYSNLDRFECRKQLVEDLQKNNLIEKIEIIKNQVSYSERTGTIIEPLLSLQWFVKMKPLADEIIKLQHSNHKVIFYPERFNDTLLTWLENIDDWCISRQLWWGHQIPIWYNKKTNEIYCDTKEPDDVENWERDADVLDTWFSSGLWPFVTLNWPNQTNLFNHFFPTDVLVTGYDIIFFWVSRMMMFSKYFTNQIPFKNVLIHGLIRDKYGKKMSKSLGNGIDPMDVIDEYGCDALRLFLTSTSSLGEDLNFNDEKIASNWNFLNKLWNGSQYIINLKNEIDINNLNLNDENYSILDYWIINNFNTMLNEVKIQFDKFNFVVATKKIINFIWQDFFNTYLEITKHEVKNLNKLTIKILFVLLINCLKILHPLCPFITEEIYSLIFNNETILNSQYASIIELKNNEEKYNLAKQLITIIDAVQKYKSDKKIKSKTLICINLVLLDDSINKDKIINLFNQFLIPNYIKIVDINLEQKTIISTNHFEIHIENINELSKEELKIDLLKQKEKLEFEVERSQSILSNSNFIQKAPKLKVDMEKEKLENYKKQLDSIIKKINEIN